MDPAASFLGGGLGGGGLSGGPGGLGPGDQREGVVSYRAFIPAASPAVRDEAARLALCVAWEDAARRIAGAYVWNREAVRFFQQPPRADARAGGPGRGYAVVQGSTHFGDCYQDEWLVVHLLLQLSRAWPEAVFQVADDDGEFLLIEAADHLPPWVTPENSSNACFLRGGRVHLLLPEQWPGGAADDDAHTSLARGLALLASASTPDQFAVNARFEAQIRARLEPFGGGGDGGATPETLNHVQRCLIPAKLAHLLRGVQQRAAGGGRGAGCPNDNWTALAAWAFYLRDPDQVRVANQLRHFPPGDGGREGEAGGAAGGGGMVLFPVRFSRMAFARLLRQKYFSPKRYATFVPPDPSARPAAAEGGSDGGAAAPAAPTEEQHAAFVQASVGMKLTCAFEMLVHQAEQEVDPATVVAGADDVAADDGGGGGGCVAPALVDAVLERLGAVAAQRRGGGPDAAPGCNDAVSTSSATTPATPTTTTRRQRVRRFLASRRRRRANEASGSRDGGGDSDGDEPLSEGQQLLEVQRGLLQALRCVHPHWPEAERAAAMATLTAEADANTRCGVPTTRGVDGNAAWLDLRPEQLEEMLRQYGDSGEGGGGGGSGGSSPGARASSSAGAVQGLPQNIFDGIQGLLSGESGFEGIEHDGDAPTSPGLGLGGRGAGAGDGGDDDDADSDADADVELDMAKLMRLLQGTATAGAGGESDGGGGGGAAAGAAGDTRDGDGGNGQHGGGEGEDRLPRGTRVRVGGLVSADGRRLNGRSGRVVRYDARMARYVVELPGRDGGGGGNVRKKLRRQNLHTTDLRAAQAAPAAPALAAQTTATAPGDGAGAGKAPAWATAGTAKEAGAAPVLPVALATPGVAVGALLFPEASRPAGGGAADPDSDDESDNASGKGGDGSTGNDDESEEVGSDGGGSSDDESGDGGDGDDRDDAADGAMFAAASEAMDAELGRTDLGKSFLRHPDNGEEGGAAGTRASDSGGGGGGADTASDGGHDGGGSDGGVDDDGGAPLQEVALDLNLVQNLLQAYKLQGGLAGPASTLLGGLGIALPDDDGDGGAGGGGGTQESTAT